MAMYFSDGHLLLKSINYNKIKPDMPVVTIQALPPDDPQKISQTLKAVVHGLAEALNTVNENVWAGLQKTVHGIPGLPAVNTHFFKVQFG